MGVVAPLPARGTVVVDERADGRTLRVSFHADEGVFVLSVWHDTTCVATVRLGPAEAGELAAAITRSLAAAVPTAPARASTG